MEFRFKLVVEEVVPELEDDDSFEPMEIVEDLGKWTTSSKKVDDEDISGMAKIITPIININMTDKRISGMLKSLVEYTR
ncbi:MAG: hypothetical protein KAS32_05360 [Candidatus Peribacteraceae bacterium]|nr:hypothetical protein [Candidatus Peribacteraceae bacterium]